MYSMNKILNRIHVVKIYTFLVIILLLFSACSSKNRVFFNKNITIDHGSSAFIGHKHYKIKSHDRLSIIFFEYPELGTKNKDVSETDNGIEVNPDGTIVMPLIGRVLVAGMSKDIVKDMLYIKYSSYLEKPALRVEILNQNIYVLGEVKNPGVISMLGHRSLTPIKVIAQRGGMTDFAQRNTIKVIRGTKKNYRIIHIDLTDMRSIQANNIDLLPDDIVYVAHNSVKDFNLPLQGANASIGWINTLFSTLTLYQIFNK